MGKSKMWVPILKDSGWYRSRAFWKSAGSLRLSDATRFIINKGLSCIPMNHYFWHLFLYLFCFIVTGSIQAATRLQCKIKVGSFYNPPASIWENLWMCVESV